MTTPSAVQPSRDVSRSIRPHLRFAFFASLLVPVILLAFFDFAPGWLNTSVQADYVNYVAASPRLSPEAKAARLEELNHTDFAEAAYTDSPAPSPLRLSLDRYGITAHFHRLRWAGRAALAITLMVVAVSVATLLLDRLARGSRESLIQCYRIAWRLAIVAAVVQLIVLGPLIVYAAYEATILYDHTYYPKLLIALSLLAALGLWAAARILLRPIKLEFNEPLARAITPTDAPEFWESLREVARCVGTTPPDHVVIGMRMNFYVTEFEVIHSAGRTHGRTLFLSHPLLRHLAPYEILAVIGHELGHFVGEDTQLTREFYPVHRKVAESMHALGAGGPGGWTSRQSLGFFYTCFEATSQAFSRERELLADRIAAEITSPELMANALIKFHVVSEAFAIGFAKAVREGAENPYNLQLDSLIREHLLPAAAFWTDLFQKHLPHPFDSHPDLQIRLAALDQQLGPDEARALVAAESPNAFDEWFGSRSYLFSQIAREAGVVVGALRTRELVARADYGTESGRALLEKHLPEQRFYTSMSNFWALLALMGLACGLILFCAIAIAFKTIVGAAIVGMMGLGLAYAMLAIWQRHRWAELILTAEGLNHSGWDKSLPFEAVKSIRLTNTNGFHTLVFKLHEPRSTPWRFALFRVPRRSVSLGITFIDEKPAELANTIYRYFIRDYSDPASPGARN